MILNLLGDVFFQASVWIIFSKSVFEKHLVCKEISV